MMTIFLALITIRISWFNHHPETLPIHRDCPGDKVLSIDVHTDNTHAVNSLESESTCCPWVAIILWYTLREAKWFHDGGINVRFHKLNRNQPQMRAVDKRANFMREKIHALLEFQYYIHPALFATFPSACEQILMVSRIIHDMMWSGTTHREGTPGVLWVWHPQDNPWSNYALSNFRILGTLDNNLAVPSTFLVFRRNAINQIGRHPNQHILNIPSRYPHVAWHLP
jgi:muconolactone delta-isomerase